MKPTRKVIDIDTGEIICTLPIEGGGQLPTYRAMIIPFDEAVEQERGADGYDFTDPNDNPYILSGEELERAVTAARSR